MGLDTFPALLGCFNCFCVTIPTCQSRFSCPNIKTNWLVIQLTYVFYMYQNHFKCIFFLTESKAIHVRWQVMTRNSISPWMKEVPLQICKLCLRHSPQSKAVVVFLLQTSPVGFPVRFAKGRQVLAVRKGLCVTQSAGSPCSIWFLHWMPRFTQTTISAMQSHTSSAVNPAISPWWILSMAICRQHWVNGIQDWSLLSGLLLMKRSIWLNVISSGNYFCQYLDCSCFMWATMYIDICTAIHGNCSIFIKDSRYVRKYVHAVLRWSI